MNRELKESEIQKMIVDYLKLNKFIAFKHRNVGIFKKDTGKYIPLSAGEKGISDIIACSPSGNFTAIEVKKRGGRPTPEQLEFLRRVSASGGIAILAYCLEDVVREMEAKGFNHIRIAILEGRPLVPKDIQKLQCADTVVARRTTKKNS